MVLDKIKEIMGVAGYAQEEIESVLSNFNLDFFDRVSSKVTNLLTQKQRNELNDFLRNENIINIKDVISFFQ